MSTIRIADKPTLDAVLSTVSNIDSNVDTLLTRGGVKYNSSTNKAQVYDTTNNTWVNLDTGGGGGGGDGDSNLVLLTQAEYDDLPDSKYSDNIAYGILDYAPVHTLRPVIKQDNTLTYNENPQTPFIHFNLDQLTITGDYPYQTNAGSYETSFTPKEGYTWANGTTTPMTFQWEIEKADGFIELKRYSLSGISLKWNMSFVIPILKVSNPNLVITSSNSSALTAISDTNNIILHSKEVTASGITLTISTNASTNYKSASVTITDISIKQYVVLTVKLDINISSPLLWGEYADDASTMEVGDINWDNFFGHYPCILDNGVELGRLNPDDFTKYEDGTDAPITTLGKDVMICFPRIGIKLTGDNNDSKMIISITNAPYAEGYMYDPFIYGNTTQCKKVYIGAYKASMSGDKLYSSSGKSPYTLTGSNGYNTMRSYANSRGTRYDANPWFPLILRQTLYTLKYKAQNAQIIIGQGLTGGSNSTDKTTGLLDKKGMDWGNPNSGTEKVKILGIEDFYGTCCEWIGVTTIGGSNGIYINSNRYYNDLVKSSTTVSYYPSGYSTYNWLKLCPFYYNYNYINDKEKSLKVMWYGFLSFDNNGGSESTYFSDYNEFYPSTSYYLAHGGNYDSAKKAGVYSFWSTYNGVNNGVGSRLVYYAV